MSSKIAQLITPGTQVAAAIGDLYTAPANEQVFIGSLSLYNTNTTAEEVEIRILESGGVTGAAYTIFKDRIAPGESREVSIVSGRRVLNAGDKVQGTTTTASKVNVFMDGIRYVQ